MLAKVIGECAQEVLIDGMRLLVAGSTGLRLLLKAVSLVFGVVELGERIGDLHPRDEGLETLHQCRPVACP